MVCEIQKSAQCRIDRAKRIVIKMPQKLTTIACFIQEESSGGKQFRKHVSCFYAQGGNVGVLSLKIACIPFFV